MIEQLKDVIVEMELLIKDCCLPVLPTKERNVKDETNPGKKVAENDRSLTVDCDNRGPYIRMDSFLMKIFSPSLYERVAVGAPDAQLPRKVGMDPMGPLLNPYTTKATRPQAI